MMMSYPGGFMALASFLFLALVMVGGILLVRALWDRTSPGAPGGGSSALRILEERFARGEIDREEFEERRRALGP
ncbi:MAG: SHOCT domain-containing protein [Actinomycetota bacterium]|nr:SHOCT domain-containing protein [Actinomycetota bacterium]